MAQAALFIAVFPMEIGNIPRPKDEESKKFSGGAMTRPSGLSVNK
jgi:hypothetical protein